MNARRVPFEAPKEDSRVRFGGFRPAKHVEEGRAHTFQFNRLEKQEIRE
jgi:hypothetical protein